MAEITIPSEPIVPKTSVESSNFLEGHDLNQPDNLCLPLSSSDEPSSSPSSSGSLNSLSGAISEKNAGIIKEEAKRDDDIVRTIDELSISEKKLSDDKDNFAPPLPLFVPLNAAMEVDFSAIDKSFLKDTSLTRPKRRGYFSITIKPNGEHEYCEEKVALRYLDLSSEKKLAINLGGMRENTKLNHYFEGLYLLRYLNANWSALDHDYFDSDDEGETNCEEERSLADIICTSKILTTIMTTPYYRKENWNLIGVVVRGSLLLTVREETNQQDKSSVENRIFLENITRRYDGTKINSEGTEFFYTISKVKVGSHRLFYSSEVSAAFNRRQVVERSFDEIELIQTQTRCVKTDTNSNARKVYMRTHGLKLWCLTFLGRIDKIVFGFREPGGWVIKPLMIKHSDIAKSSNSWSPKTCVDFMNKLFTFIKELAPTELKPFEINYSSTTDNFGKIVFKTLDEPVEDFIPTWYINRQQPEN